MEEPQVMLRTLERTEYLVVEFGLNDQNYSHLRQLNVRLERFVNWSRFFALRTGPTTQYLFFTLDPGLTNLGSIKEIGKQWTNLLSFKLATLSKISQKTFRQFLRPVIAELKSLKYFKIHVEGTVVADLLQVLTTLPYLEDIYLAISLGPIIEIAPSALPPPRPYTGKHLMLQCEAPYPLYFPTVLKISAELSMFYSTIKLVSDPNSNEDLVSNAISSIIKYQPEVRFINFLDREKPIIKRTNNMVYISPETYPLSSPCIMPLTRLENLTDIDFDTCGPVMVTPELLDALASTSPLLRTCHLSPYRLPRSNQHMKSNEFLITLQDVMHFLGRCTRLFEVGLACDARKPADYVKQAIPTSPSWVAHIHIGGSRIDDVEYVGELLASLPRMGLVVNMPPDYLISTFLPTLEEQQMWYLVNVQYLVRRECGCGRIHEEDTGPPEAIEYPYKVIPE
jgi:hypothetical protein